MEKEDIKAFIDLADIYVEWADSCKNSVQAMTLRLVAYQIYALYIGLEIKGKGL